MAAPLSNKSFSIQHSSFSIYELHPMPDLLEFEEPIGVLLKEIEALSLMPRTPDRERSIETLRRRADELRAELYASLTPWQRVLVARHPNRPNTLDYIERLFTGWEIGRA